MVATSELPGSRGSAVFKPNISRRSTNGLGLHISGLTTHTELRSFTTKLRNSLLRRAISNDLERLSNLLPLLAGAVNQDFLSPEDGQIDKRRAALVAALEEAKDNTARPNNSLHAHALLLLIRITTLRPDDDASDLDEIWNEFTSVIEQSTGLGSFPFELIAATLGQLGDVLPDSPAFDRLYETLTDALSDRKREGEAAKLNSERGYQKLRKSLPYDAIRWFGRAVSDLIKAEYEDELVEALCGCSIAYMEAGLYWAARNYALLAATTQFAKFKVSGSADDVNPAVLSQWFECELQLGRVPFVLTAYELGAMVRHARSRTPKQAEFAEERRIEQGHRIGALVIGTSFKDLKRLGTFPAALDRLGLLQVSTTLMFLMSGEQALRDELVVPAEETSDSIESIFDRLAAAGKSAELPTPDYLLDEWVLLHSRVLGCEITAVCENNLTSIGIADAILGALESLLATSLNLRIFPHLDRFQDPCSVERRCRNNSNAPIRGRKRFDCCGSYAQTTIALRHARRGVWISQLVAAGRYSAIRHFCCARGCRGLGEHRSRRRKRLLSSHNVLEHTDRLRCGLWQHEPSWR